MERHRNSTLKGILKTGPSTPAEIIMMEMGGMTIEDRINLKQLMYAKKNQNNINVPTDAWEKRLKTHIQKYKYSEQEITNENDTPKYIIKEKMHNYNKEQIEKVTTKKSKVKNLVEKTNVKRNGIIEITEQPYGPYPGKNLVKIH